VDCSSIICDITVQGGFWTNKLHEVYHKVLCLVQNKGRPGDWTISAAEGMHHLTTPIIRNLACKLDTINGFILSNAIDESYFEENSVGIATNVEGSVFRENIYKSTFKSKTPNLFWQEFITSKELDSMDVKLHIS
jgi:hypothetical protein